MDLFCLSVPIFSRHTWPGWVNHLLMLSTHLYPRSFSFNFFCQVWCYAVLCSQSTNTSQKIFSCIFSKVTTLDLLLLSDAASYLNFFFKCIWLFFFSFLVGVTHLCFLSCPRNSPNCSVSPRNSTNCSVCPHFKSFKFRFHCRI